MQANEAVMNGVGTYHLAAVNEKECSQSELYTRYFPKVYHSCYSYAKNHDDAFDMAQDVMLKVFNNLETFEGKSTLSTWLFSITRNHCLSMMAKKRLLYYEDVHSAQNLAEDECSAEELEKREKKENLEFELQHFIDLLPENDKRMLELKYFHKYSVKDLQEEFSLSASAVKMRLLRARQRIEQILELRNAA